MKRDSKINGIYRMSRGVFRQSTTGIRRHSRTGKIFIGPSVGGSDKEYVKVISGEVDRRKPSFV